MNRHDSTDFSYWKKPWHKHILLLMVILEVIQLISGITDLRELKEAAVFSTEFMAEYELTQKARFALDGSMAAVFLAMLVIGETARSKASARLAEGIALTVWAVVWIAAGTVLGLFDLNAGIGVFGWVIALIALAGAAHSYWSWFRAKRNAAEDPAI